MNFIFFCLVICAFGVVAKKSLPSGKSWTLKKIKTNTKSPCEKVIKTWPRWILCDLIFFTSLWSQPCSILSSLKMLLFSSYRSWRHWFWPLKILRLKYQLSWLLRFLTPLTFCAWAEFLPPLTLTQPWSRHRSSLVIFMWGQLSFKAGHPPPQRSPLLCRQSVDKCSLH